MARDQSVLFAQLRRELARSPEIEVVQDRRQRQRRQRATPATRERRLADRRLVSVEEELVRYGRAVVER